MAEKKHALLIFTKPPLPGIVKTRMTTEYGGFLTMEQAAGFYRNCFYDVCEMGMHALIELQQKNERMRAEDPTVDKITYDFFCSSTPADSLEKMKEVFDTVGTWPMEVNFIVDAGSSFDEHFNDACQQLFDRGYESFVAIGGDVPTMPKSHIKQAFQWLDYFQAIGKPGFAYAPCQECGTSLVGYSYNTPIDHTGVYYNMDGRPALDGYLEKIEEGDIPSAYFDPVADIDEVTDLAHAVSCMKSIAEAAKYQDLFVPRRTLGWVEFMGIKVSTPPNDNHDPRDYLDGAAEAPTGAQELTDEDRQRVADLNAAMQGKQAAENAYEAGKYE
ncbi:MAG: DUF2064 domain-containing protein [Eggerthellaceae bacterium]|nr:DUF2064 domain-containing protein [Eggerthellaceae bacterium]